MDCDEHRDEAYKLIRIVQEDTIRDTVEECASNLRHTSGQFNSDYRDEKNRIYSVADKLIKELKDGNKD